MKLGRVTYKDKLQLKYEEMGNWWLFLGDGDYGR